jgi:hypothetical protein
VLPIQIQEALQGFFAAQGLHGLQGLAAQGFMCFLSFMPFWAAHGLQGLSACFAAAHGLQGLQGFFFAAHGLQGLLEWASISGFCAAVGLSVPAITRLDAEMANTPPTTAAYSGLRLM